MPNIDSWKIDLSSMVIDQPIWTTAAQSHYYSKNYAVIDYCKKCNYKFVPSVELCNCYVRI